MDPRALFRFETIGLRIERRQAMPMRRRHSHTEIELNLAQNGFIGYRFAGEKIVFQPGRLYVFSGLTPHELVDMAPRTTFFYLTVPLTAFMHWRLPQNVTAPLLRGEILTDLDEENDLRRFERWWEDLEGSDPRRARVTLPEVQARLERMALSGALATAWRRGGHARGSETGTGALLRVETMLHLIAERFAEPLTLRALAAPTGWHPHYAAGQFRRLIGVPPGEFLLRQRIAHARHLLATTQEKVITIAQECGFATLSSFYAAFSRIVGCAPRGFRKSTSAPPERRQVVENTASRGRAG